MLKKFGNSLHSFPIILILFLSFSNDLCIAQNHGEERIPLWAGAQLEEKEPSAVNDLAVDAPSTVANLILGRVDEFVQGCSTNLANQSAGKIPSAATTSFAIGTLKASCNYKLLSDTPIARNAGSAKFDFTGTITGTVATDLLQKLTTKIDNNTGEEMLKGTVSLTLTGKVAFGYMKLPGATTWQIDQFVFVDRTVQGEAKGFEFFFDLLGAEDLFQSEELRKQYDDSLKPLGVNIDWTKSSLLDETGGKLTGKFSGTFNVTYSGITKPLKVFNVTEYEVCKTMCTLYVRSKLQLTATKVAVPADQLAGSLSLNRSHFEQYKGTMTTLTPVPQVFKLRWNPDLNVYKYGTSVWDQNLKSQVSGLSGFYKYSGNITSEANLYPLQRSRSIVQSKIVKNYDAGSATNMSSYRTTIVENRAEKQVGDAPVTRSGTGSISQEMAMTPTMKSSFTNSGHFDSVDPRLVIDSPAASKGLRMDLWSNIQLKSYLLDYGYPGYLFTPLIGNAKGTLVAKTSAVPLLPKYVAYITGFTDEDQVKFASDLQRFKKFMDELKAKGVNVLPEQRVLTKAALLSALGGLPNGTMLITFMHGGPAALYPAGDAQGSAEEVTLKEMRDVIEKKNLILYPLAASGACFAARHTGLANTMIGSIGTAVGTMMNGDLPTDWYGYGTNSINGSTARLIEKLKARLGVCGSSQPVPPMPPYGSTTPPGTGMSYGSTATSNPTTGGATGPASY